MSILHLYKRSSRSNLPFLKKIIATPFNSCSLKKIASRSTDSLITCANLKLKTSLENS